MRYPNQLHDQLLGSLCRGDRGSCSLRHPIPSALNLANMLNQLTLTLETKDLSQPVLLMLASVVYAPPLTHLLRHSLTHTHTFTQPLTHPVTAIRFHLLYRVYLKPLAVLGVFTDLAVAALEMVEKLAEATAR